MRFGQAMANSPDTPGFRYRAFVSYSHQDEAWAQWLHKALETYRVPSRLVGTQTAAGIIPRRLIPVFRDRDELASATDLNRKVNEALEHSANLIVICSPNSAKSRWVNEEVLAYKRLGGAERIFCLIVGGEPNASDLPGRDADECFAPALRFQLGADGQPTGVRTEPIAADAREGKDGKPNAKLKLIAGMLDVGFDALKQRELQRRNRRMAAITALALIVMAITTTLAITAVIARHDAERRQKQAEDLVGFMLGDLNDKLSQVNRLDIIESVDDKAMAYFKSLPTTDVTADSLLQRAKALERIGSVRLDQGHLPAALESYEASLSLVSAQAAVMPNDLSRQLAYAENVSFIGTAHWYQGDLEQAARDFRLAESILARAEKLDPADPKLLFQKQVVENNLGHVFESRGLLDEALVAYQNALQLVRRLLAGNRDNPEWRETLGGAHNNLGKIALMRGDLTTAITEYALDDRIETDLSARDPRNKDQLQNVFRVRAILGRTLALAGNVDSAIRDLREAVDIAGQLRQQDPTITSITENLALYQMQLGRLLRLTGDLQEASALTNRSIEALAALTQQDSANAYWQRELAEARTERAEQLLAQDKPDDAREQVRRALAVLDPALEKHNEDRSLLLSTVSARLLLASISAGQEARQLRESCQVLLGGVKSGAGDPRLLALKVSALLGLGRKEDVSPVVARLQASGYGDPAFVAELSRQGIAYHPDERMAQVLRAKISDIASKGMSAE
jgi:tetratricopeptide (TPR) repeat protein